MEDKLKVIKQYLGLGTPKENDTFVEVNNMIIVKVWEATTNHNTLMITVPKKSGIKKGDYVKLVKVDE